MIKPLLLLAITTILFSQDTTITTGEYDETFDPLKLNEPEIEWPLMIRAGEQEPKQKVESQGDTTEIGYRIQVLSTQDYETAYDVQSTLMEKYNGEVYVTFDAPNYKVRVGNFQSRSEAEKIQKELMDMGYRMAWIIRTQIVVKPRRW